MTNVSFLIDGFNIYHSTNDVLRKTHQNVKWLNIKSLCDSYLPLISKDAVNKSIYYFSAYANHTSHETVNRHKLFVKALESTGINVIINRFKKTSVYCHHCKMRSTHHEEKRTDMAIGIKILEVMLINEADVVVLVSGDTDMIPAIQMAKKYYPGKEIIALFPFKRDNAEMRQATDRHFKIKPNTYARHQFPDEIILDNGEKLLKPDHWNVLEEEL